MRCLLTILTIMIWSCSSNKHKKPDQEDSKSSITDKEANAKSEYTKIDKTKLITALKDVCSIGAFEVIDLYPILDSIPNDEHENLVLVDSMKRKGFRITNSSQGNWIEGPRIVSFALSNSQCDCQIDKLYHSTEMSKAYRVTERIKCEKTKIKLLSTLNKAKIDSLTSELDKLMAEKSLSKYSYPDMSGCGGGVYGYYSDSTLLIIDATHKAELGHTRRKIYWSEERPIKITYREHFAEWKRYDEKYPSEKYDWDPSKMTYTDTTYQITLGKEHQMLKMANGKQISKNLNAALANRLIDCSFEMKGELKREKILEE